MTKAEELEIRLRRYTLLQLLARENPGDPNRSQEAYDYLERDEELKSYILSLSKDYMKRVCRQVIDERRQEIMNN